MFVVWYFSFLSKSPNYCIYTNVWKIEIAFLLIDSLSEEDCESNVKQQDQLHRNE